MDCSGKIALVTGAAAGIGRACALALAAHGARIVATDIDEAGVQETVSLITAAGGSARAMVHDVTQEAAWSEVYASIDAEESALHILVNNAGIAVASPITEMSLADWQRQNAINLDGVFLGTKHAIPRMAKSGKGSIINISSVAGLIGAPGLSAYNATKGGVRLFTKGVAIEMATAGLPVRVNSVHPGIIDTAIWEKEMSDASEQALAGVDQGDNRPSIELVAEMTVPGGKLGQPIDVANAVVFLASDASSYMTGSEVVVDHGLSAR